MGFLDQNIDVQTRVEVNENRRRRSCQGNELEIGQKLNELSISPKRVVSNWIFIYLLLYWRDGIYTNSKFRAINLGE